MATIPIAEQVAEVERELRDRNRRYGALVASGRWKADTAERKFQQMQAALASLRTIALHADGLRILISYLRRPDVDDTAPAPKHDELEAILRQPAVQELLATFPDAVLSGVAPVPYPQDFDPDAHDHHELDEARNASAEAGP